MRHGTKLTLAVGVIALVAVVSAYYIIYVPTVRMSTNDGPGCEGGLACVVSVSLSCAWFGFGTVRTGFGDVIFSYHCSASY